MSTAKALVSLLLLLLLTPAPARGAADDVFRGREGCFLPQESGATRPLARLGTLCAERVSPCSTFKIPNSLIGLDTGVKKRGLLGRQVVKQKAGAAFSHGCSIPTTFG